jgi:serine/threonine-protein kinase
MAAGPSSEESRHYLQERLILLSKALFFGLGGVAVFSGQVIYLLYPPIRPPHANWIFLASMSGVALLGITWRFVLAPRPLPERTLHAIDIFYAAGSGLGLGCSAYFAPQLRAAAYTALVLAICVVILRAIIVPSTRARTAAVSAVLFVPINLGALGLALGYAEDVPGPAFFIGALVLTTTATVLAATGADVMHALRKDADAATQLGQYTLGEKIGEGGMGVVYRAQHMLLRRPTAIKLLAPERVGAATLERFEREVQHTSQLTHPNTVAVYDYGRSTGGAFYYAMEYLDGIDLEQLVRRHGPQPPGRVVHLLVQVCGALQEAHDRGIVHRDVKPANIIACERGATPDVAKVVDFGLVKELTRDSTSTTQTILGTPAYLAPEAITESRIGPAVDLYALGAVGYFLLAGRQVFSGVNALDTCLKHVTETPAPLDAPSGLAAVIHRALAKSPSDRYPNAAAMAAALRDADPGGWDEDAARAWWDQRRAVLDAAIGAAKMKTITVELEGRP